MRKTYGDVNGIARVVVPFLAVGARVVVPFLILAVVCKKIANVTTAVVMAMDDSTAVASVAVAIALARPGTGQHCDPYPLAEEGPSRL